jgi:hypothetical protein
MHVQTSYSKDGYTLHVHTDDGVDGYTLHVHTAGGGKVIRPACLLCWRWIRIHTTSPHCRRYKENTLFVHNAEGVGWIHPTAGGEKAYTLHIHTAFFRNGYTLTSTLLVVDRKPHHVYTGDGNTGIHHHFHTVDSGNGYNTSKLLLMERDTPSVPHVYIVDCGKIYTLTSSPYGGGEGYTLMFTLTIHPHVYIVDSENEYTLTFTPMLVVKRDSLSRPHC